MADIAASVLARLKNKAAESGRSYQLCLQLFCQEEFLRRLIAPIAVAKKYAGIGASLVARILCNAHKRPRLGTIGKNCLSLLCRSDGCAFCRNSEMKNSMRMIPQTHRVLQVNGLLPLCSPAFICGKCP